MKKLTKTQSGYINPPPKSLWPINGKGIRCKTCIYFKRNACAIVSGSIHPQACCNLWALKKPKTNFICGEDIEDILIDNEYY